MKRTLLFAFAICLLSTIYGCGTEENYVEPSEFPNNSLNTVDPEEEEEIPD